MSSTPPTDSHQDLTIPKEWLDGTFGETMQKIATALGPGYVAPRTLTDEAVRAVLRRVVRAAQGVEIENERGTAEDWKAATRDLSTEVEAAVAALVARPPAPTAGSTPASRCDLVDALLQEHEELVLNRASAYRKKYDTSRFERAYAAVLTGPAPNPTSYSTKVEPIMGQVQVSPDEVAYQYRDTTGDEPERWCFCQKSLHDAIASDPRIQVRTVRLVDLAGPATGPEA